MHWRRNASDIMKNDEQRNVDVHDESTGSSGIGTNESTGAPKAGKKHLRDSFNHVVWGARGQLRAFWRLLVMTLAGLPLSLLALLFVLSPNQGALWALAVTMGVVGMSYLVAIIGVSKRFGSCKPRACLGLHDCSIAGFIYNSLAGFICGCLGFWCTMLVLSHDKSTKTNFQAPFTGTSKGAMETSSAFLQWLGGISVSLFVYAWGAFYEEFIFRGYVMRTITAGMVSCKFQFPCQQSGYKISPSAALAIGCASSSVAWGLYHSILDYASFDAVLYISLYGLIFSCIYVWKGDISVVTGVHWGWNFAESVIFGSINSGMTAEFFMWRTTVLGPKWFTGGNFGPEAGVSGCLGIFAAFVVAALYLYCRGPFRIPKHILPNENSHGQDESLLRGPRVSAVDSADSAP